MKIQITEGVRYIFLATLFFTIMQTIAKDLSHLPVFQVLFFRSAVTALFCIIYLYRNNISFKGNHQRLLILRALFGITSMTLFFITLQRIPFGASVSLKYLSPVFAAIFAIIFLKERVKLLQWFFFGIALVGVFLLKSFDTRIDTINLILSVSGAAFGGLVYVIIRKIGNSEHPMVIVNYFMFSASVITGLLMIPTWQNPIGMEWVYLILMGSLGYFAQVFMTKAFQIEAASRIAQFKYIEVIYSLLIGLIWFGEAYSIWSLVGILLIFSSMFFNVIMKQKG